jgi:fucokinase
MLPVMANQSTDALHLAAVAERARQLYAAVVAGIEPAPAWWTAVVITASSQQQAERYRAEIRRRYEAGQIPEKARYVVVPDLGGKRIGSGGATLNALRELATNQPAEWWEKERVLLIHCGGDSRRLPQYSLSGKLFSAVPGGTVFDEMLALSSGWVERLPAGLVVGSGDVILTFDPEVVNWNRPGISGLGLLQPAEVGTGHGVYVADEQGRVYAFLQKPSVAQIAAAGGLRQDDLVAVDSGLMRFDAETAARMTQVARTILAGDDALPEIDLYRHFTMALTGEWKPDAHDASVLEELAGALRNVPFLCSVVPGGFTHIGTTSLFRRLMTENAELARLHEAQQHWGATRQPGVRSAGVIADCVFVGGADLKPGTVAIECHLEGPVRAAAGAVLHGLDGIPGSVEAPEDTVAHQLPVVLPDGKRGVVVRVYGVEDDPKAAGDGATWFGRSLLAALRTLGIDADLAWAGVAPDERTLWNAALFPVGSPSEAWACAQWMMGLGSGYSAAQWSRAHRLSLATSTQYADGGALEAARARRLKSYWRMSALSLVESGTDISPLLANAPGAGPLADAGNILCRKAAAEERTAPTEAARLYYTAGLFLGQAGLAHESGRAQESAFRMVQQAVEAGARCAREANIQARPWQADDVTVDGPARIDLGGGWSDSPPFCLDWGGTVLNVAVLLDGCYPIRAQVRRLPEPVVRCVSASDDSADEYRSCEEILQPSAPGDGMSIPRTALRMTGLFRPGEPLTRILERTGGGLEIRTEVNLPMGSGLGTSSILAACVLRAIAGIGGEDIDDQTLSDRVMRLEQLMTTGGGWQDQAGGIFPGAKLLVTGPGLRQRIRVQPLAWSPERRRDFEQHVVLYYTGIRRVARDLLRQVVGRYLARETATVQVLHSIKTLALEMSHAMGEGDWEQLGSLMDRHWKLNQILDPATTNAPINAVLERLRPYIYGAKLAGAGGGGFMILIGRSVEAAQELRRVLTEEAALSGGAVYGCTIAAEGLRIR